MPRGKWIRGRGELPEDLDGFDELTPAAVQHWTNLGYSQAAMARRYNVTRAYPGWIIDFYGLEKSKRSRALTYFPFKVSAKQGESTQCKRLRDHLDFMVNDGEDWSYDRRKRQRYWYNKLKDENLVVEHDPDIPPEPGVCKSGGWAYRNRLDSDEDFLIRFNEYVDLPEFEKENWRFPQREP